MIKLVKIYGKTTDSFNMRVKDEHGATVLDYDNYPPTKFGISRDGDSIEIKIDNETGKIEGWVPLTEQDIHELSSS